MIFNITNYYFFCVLIDLDLFPSDEMFIKFIRVIKIKGYKFTTFIDVFFSFVSVITQMKSFIL